MGEDTEKKADHPCCSKSSESQKSLANDDDDKDNRDGTNTRSTVSARSMKSRLDMGKQLLTQPLGKADRKHMEKNRSKRQSGKIEKRKRSAARRPIVRKKPRRTRQKISRRGQTESASTVFTRVSSRKSLTLGVCEYCAKRYNREL